MSPTASTVPPRKAVVLAAGLGQRLRPLTWFLPKPLMPLADQPLIARMLDLLESWGVEEVAVNLHWQANLLRDYLSAWRGRARIVCVYEPIILGTGGALRPLRDFIGGSAFWLANADIVAELDPAPLQRAFAGGQALAAAWLEPRTGPRTVVTDRQGHITDFRSRTPGAPGTATFCGLQLVSPRVFEFLPERACGSIVEAYENGLRAGEFVAGVRIRGSHWDDAGTPERYLAIRRRLQRHAARQPTPAAADRGGPLPTPFELRPGRGPAVVCRAFDWPDPALAPLLAAMQWPLARTGVCPLGARGSDRSFCRLLGPSRRAIYLRYGTLRSENARYAGHARLLAGAGVPVPRVLAALPEARALALADWGDCSLERQVHRRPGDALALYEPVLQAAARLHTTATEAVRAAGVAIEPPLDATTFRWERELFANHLLRGRLGLEGLPAEVAVELELVAARLLNSPRVVVHRDLQSSNVLCRGRQIALIDFQGMRLGPAAYDLASLLCDPYVQLAPALRTRLLARYVALCPACAEVADDFPWAAVQRLSQALGAYARLTALGLTQFAAFIAPAAATLGAMAHTCGLPHTTALAGQICSAPPR